MDEAGFARFAVPTINKYSVTEQFSNVQDGLFNHVMQDVMMGKTYVTPADMTQKKAHKVNNGQQPIGAPTDTRQDDMQ